MGQLAVDKVTLPPAPPCWSWCEGHEQHPRYNPRDGWDDVNPAGVLKTCRHTLLDDKVGFVRVIAYSWVHWPGSAFAPGPPQVFPTETLTVGRVHAPYVEINVNHDEMAADQIGQLGIAIARAHADLLTTYWRQADGAGV